MSTLTKKPFVFSYLLNGTIAEHRSVLLGQSNLSGLFIAANGLAPLRESSQTRTYFLFLSYRYPPAPPTPAPISAPVTGLPPVAAPITPPPTAPIPAPLSVDCCLEFMPVHPNISVRLRIETTITMLFMFSSLWKLNCLSFCSCTGVPWPTESICPFYIHDLTPGFLDFANLSGNTSRIA